MDQCTNCSCKGDIRKCIKTPCNQHESWMVGELKKLLAKTGCHDIFCYEYDTQCARCKVYNREVRNKKKYGGI